MTALTDSVLDVACSRVHDNGEHCGALPLDTCRGPDLLPCPAHPERVAAAMVAVYGAEVFRRAIEDAAIAEFVVDPDANVRRIVAWLRDTGNDEEGNAALRLADAIERGAWAGTEARERKPLVYCACPAAPTALEIESIDRWVAAGVYGPAKRAEMITTIIERNLRRAKRWLRWFAINVPQWVVIAPWIAEIEAAIEAGATEAGERAAGLARCREVASRCAAVAQVGGRVSSGMAEEGKAAAAVVDLTWAGEEPPSDAEASVMLVAQCEAGRMVGGGDGEGE